jgi:long-chain fatty acid transport protein
MRLKLLSLSVMAMGATALSTQALASGYNFGSQSVSAQGTAHANAAEAADPSTIYYNPAGMDMLDGDQVTVGVTTVIPKSSFTNNGSTNILGQKTTGTDGGTFAPSAVEAPTLYVSHQVNDRIHIGLGVFVPYGAELNYGNDWVGRYAIETIKLEALNFNPAISIRLDDRQSIGFGISAQYLKANLSKAVDAPSAGLALDQQYITNAYTTTGDGQVGMSANGWGYGFNLGYLYKLDEHTRFGLAYRSEIHTNLTGSASWDFSAVTNATTRAILAGQHPNSAATVNVVTPQSASASFYRDLTDKVALMGTATWTGHSSMNNIDIKFPGTTENDMLINQEWKNSWLFALGMNYKYDDKLMLRSGVALDNTPVSSTALTDPALPDGDRYWLSLGANYKFDKHQSIDFSYSYVFIRNVNVDYTDVCYGQGLNCAYTGNGETTSGSYKSNLQLIGLAYNYRF